MFYSHVKVQQTRKKHARFEQFQDEISFFFVSRGGDSPPPRAPPQSPRPRRFGTLFIPSLLFLFFRNFLFTPLFFHFYMSLNSLAPESAGGADSTLISYIQHSFPNFVYTFTHSFLQSICHFSTHFLAISACLSIFSHFFQLKIC